MTLLRLCGLLLVCSRLIDAKLDIITSDPDVQVGNQVLLLCKVDSEGDISWLKDNEEVDEDLNEVKRTDESSSTLTLKNVQLSDSGTYTCLFENEHGTRRATYQLYVHQAPDFGNTRTYHEFLVNQTVTIPCVVSGKPEVEIYWLRNDRILNDDGRGSLRILPDRSLQIVGIQQEDRGTYTCEGKIKGRPVTRNLKISVVVNEPPTILIHEERKSVHAGPNTSVSIVCLVKGEPTPNISWMLYVHHQKMLISFMLFITVNLPLKSKVIVLPERLGRQDNETVIFITNKQAKYHKIRFFGVGPIRSSHPEGCGLCVSCLKMKAGA